MKRFYMLTIAVTGGIACGKSTVGRLLEARGIPVCDADEVAHALMNTDVALGAALREAFGPGIADADGTIDRTRLGRLVFRDATARERLNRLVHPPVRSALLAWRRALAASQPAACAALIPLLFEAGMDRDWDITVCVAAAPAVQEARLRARGLSADEARHRMAAQMPMADKIARSDFVMLNNGGMDVIERYTGWLLERILEADHG